MAVSSCFLPSVSLDMLISLTKQSFASTSELLSQDLFFFENVTSNSMTTSPLHIPLIGKYPANPVYKCNRSTVFIV